MCVTSHISIQPSTARVRVRVGETVIADSRNTQLLTEGNLPSRHYFPREDVAMKFLVASASVTHCPHKGDARYWGINSNGETLDDVVWSYEEPLAEMSPIAGLLSFYDERVTLEIED
ncbi:MAG: hypothetical protein CL444_03650 [Acidimicrobiaceae bacterium]|nr:hypothetical protein [Acidimicrobiaceae bacterium]